MNIFLAGATGAIGKRLLPQLLARGHQVTTTTRTSAKLNAVRAAGAKAVLRHSRKLGTIRTSIRNSRLPTGCAPKLQNTLSPLPDRRVPVDLSPGATWLA
jgi:NAD(P)-dependent dehydrogenase (short-subunit alcohol dehydrogenase family)